MKHSSTFGSLVRECRIAAGLTQTELAEKLGMTQNAIARWELYGVYPLSSRLPEVVRGLGQALRIDRRKIMAALPKDFGEPRWKPGTAFGRFVRKHRKARGLSLRELALLMGKNFDAVYNAERGGKTVHRSQFEAWLKGLQCDPEELQQFLRKAPHEAPSPSRLSQYLRNARKESALSQEELGNLLDISKARISQMETADSIRFQGKVTLHEVAKALAVPVSELLVRLPKKKKKWTSRLPVHTVHGAW